MIMHSFEQLILLTVFDNFNFWSTSYCKNGSNFCQLGSFEYPILILHNLSNATTFCTNSILSYGSFMCLAFTFTKLTFYVYEFCIFSLSFVLVSYVSLEKIV